MDVDELFLCSVGAGNPALRPSDQSGESENGESRLR